MSLSRIKATAARYDAEVLDEGTSIEVWTPSGTRWVASIAHTLSVGVWSMNRTDMYRSLLEDMRLGVEPCDASDCEICHPVPG
jgi:hypothetical protein